MQGDAGRVLQTLSADAACDCAGRLQASENPRFYRGPRRVLHGETKTAVVVARTLKFAKANGRLCEGAAAFCSVVA
jgi:hypothetical protein